MEAAEVVTFQSLRVTTIKRQPMAAIDAMVAKVVFNSAFRLAALCNLLSKRADTLRWATVYGARSE